MILILEVLANLFACVCGFFLDSESSLDVDFDAKHRQSFSSNQVRRPKHKTPRRLIRGRSGFT